MAPRVDPPGIFTSGTISRPEIRLKYICEYCRKEIDNGVIRNIHVYCSTHHAILGALKGEKE